MSKLIKVRVTLTEELLGMSSADQHIHETYIASKAPDAVSTAEEVEALGVDEVVNKQMTVFPRDYDGTPILWDYQIRGMFKDSMQAIKKVPGTACSRMKAYKKNVDQVIFVEPRRIRIDLSGMIGDCQRPLRASTPQGERIALANSETVPAGSCMTFSIRTLSDDVLDAVIECLNYGEYRGLGQWRNSGKGRFDYEILSIEEYDESSRLSRMKLAPGVTMPKKAAPAPVEEVAAVEAEAAPKKRGRPKKVVA